MREALAAFAGLDGARVEALGGGLLNESYAVSSASGEYIAQRVNPIFAPGVHDNIRAVTEHLASRGESTFRLCETRAGALFVDVPEAGRWRLMERLPGVTFDTCSTPAQARSAGRRVAAFHSALVDFDAPLAPLGFPFHDTPLHLADLRDAIERHADHARAADVRRLAVDVFAAAESCRPPLDLPLRVVHGDLKFSNVLFAGPRPPGSDDAQALIDLDTVCRLPIYLDLGDALRSWCNRRVEDDPEAELDTGALRGGRGGLPRRPRRRADRSRVALVRGRPRERVPRAPARASPRTRSRRATSRGTPSASRRRASTTGRARAGSGASTSRPARRRPSGCGACATERGRSGYCCSSRRCLRRCAFHDSDA